MTLDEWLSLSDAEREVEKNNWHVFEPGYWHSIANQVAARFAAEFSSAAHVQRICKSLYRAEELIVAVQTDLAPPETLPLPEAYCGFRVLQFASTTPEGVLVDVAPPAGSGT
jgi:hypothetical protein